jgi:heme-degrading monooxygenase HmoA
MLLLESHPHQVTLINTFQPEEVGQQAHVSELISRLDHFTAAQPGFLGAAVHASLDGERVTNVAIWEDEASYRGMLFRMGQRPNLRRLVTGLRQLARYEPHLCHHVGTLPDDADAVIEAEAKRATLINLYRVKPGCQNTVLDLLLAAAEFFRARRCGFLSSSLHRSLDGSHVVNYSQWESSGAFRREMEEAGRYPLFGGHEEILASDVRLYAVRDVIEPEAGKARAA